MDNAQTAANKTRLIAIAANPPAMKTLGKMKDWRSMAAGNSPNADNFRPQRMPQRLPERSKPLRNESTVSRLATLIREQQPCLWAR